MNRKNEPDGHEKWAQACNENEHNENENVKETTHEELRSQAAFSNAYKGTVRTTAKHEKGRLLLRSQQALTNTNSDYALKKVAHFWRSQEAFSNAYKGGVETTGKHEKGLAASTCKKWMRRWKSIKINTAHAFQPAPKSSKWCLLSRP